MVDMGDDATLRNIMCRIRWGPAAPGSVGAPSAIKPLLRRNIGRMRPTATIVTAVSLQALRRGPCGAT
jgi:hypothetical protein